MDIPYRVSLSPGSHPIGIGLGSLLRGLGLLHLPYMEFLEPGFIFQGFSLGLEPICSSCLVLAAGLICWIYCRALTSFYSSKAVLFKPFLLSPASVLCM